jgi:tryptophan-rich sensory protein
LLFETIRLKTTQQKSHNFPAHLMTTLQATSKWLAHSLAANLLGPLLLVALVNAAIFGLGWQDSFRPPKPGLFLKEIPGWFIGAVWTVLFLAMGWARWRLGKVASNASARARAWLTALIVACAVYPFYTAGLSSVIVGFLGNLITIALSAFVATRIWQADKPATAATLAVITWVSFATFYIVDQQRWLW